MTDSKQIDLLLVDDDAGDVALMKEGLQDGKICLQLHVVEDGEKAVKYLRKEPPYTDAVRPDIILLDLNMPRKDGRETLREIKLDENLRSIPIVILSTSDAEADIMKCYEYGANCYVTKPVGFVEFSKIVNTIEEFWFTIVKVPRRGN